MINEIIVEYLKTNRRLVIPEFGAFVTKESGEIIFSALLRNDDGVLASLLAARGMNEMEIAVTIDRYIFEARHELESYGYCRLGALGTLRQDGDNLRLYQMKEVKAATTSVATEPSVEKVTNNETPQNDNKTKAVEERVAEEPTAPKSEPKSTRPTPPRKPQRKKVDIIMVFAIIILLGTLAAIGYGYYVSTLGTIDDDEAIEALRVVPTEDIK